MRGFLGVLYTLFNTLILILEKVGMNFECLNENWTKPKCLVGQLGSRPVA